MIPAKMVGVKIHGSKAVRVFYNEDGSPVCRKEPKARMSKKERRKKRREEKEKQDEKRV